MAENPILNEIYAAREKLLAEADGDVHAYVENARQRALASGRSVVVPKRRDRSRPAAAPPVCSPKGQPSAPGVADESR